MSGLRSMSEAPRDGSVIYVIWCDWSGGDLLFFGEAVEDGEEGWFSAKNLELDLEAEADLGEHYAGWLPVPAGALAVGRQQGWVALKDPAA